MKTFIFVTFFLYLTSIVYSAPGDLKWKFKTGGGIYKSSPCVSEGVAYIGKY
ncbi:MAG: PQQ-binding-like beta-propeller repeat protein [Candidatus Coatesbacteria bacterium]|nr:PQQ-binding-like beta-propeller repeat protein [Candidatus Coatesbacteria bacterium]